MTVPEIDVRRLGALGDGAVVVDVREVDEWEAGHVPHATLLPLSSLAERWTEVPTDRTVHVVCRSGGRSLEAARFLRQQGIDAVNVTGGMLAWGEADLEVETGA